jgi:hypothetical protein
LQRFERCRGGSTVERGARRRIVAEYLHAEIAAVEQLSQARFDAMQRAVDKALEATERRFEGVNEFRATLSDQADERVRTQDRLCHCAEAGLQAKPIPHAGNVFGKGGGPCRMRVRGPLLR